MSFNKISGGSAIPPALPIALAAGDTFMLPVGQGIVGTFGNVATPQLATQNPLTGQYQVFLGNYTTLQVYDQGAQYWRTVAVGSPSSEVQTISADGFNYRLANTTGCPVGALITNAGSGGTNGFYGYQSFGPGQGSQVTIQNGVVTSGNTVFTITPSAGGSQWNAIIGGAINTTISFSGTVYQNGPFGGTGTSVAASAGSGYSKPPIIVFYPPSNQGQQPYILPTAVCAISGGAISSVTVTNQGAGLLGLPGIVVIPQPGDTTGGGAVLGWTSGNSAQVGSGTLLAMWPVYYGTALTAVPTFTFAGTGNPSPSATAIMNFSVTGFSGGTGGSGYTTGAFSGGIVSGSAANTNPLYDKLLSVPQFPPFAVAAAGTPSLSGPYGGANIQAVPTFTPLGGSGASAVTVTVGGQNDTIVLTSF